MATYYIRVEAVNLWQSIYDTNDLSTIRGGGLRALECATVFGPEFNLTEIYTGASQGLFRFEATKEEAIARKKKVVDHLLAKYPEQIINVEMREADRDFQQDIRLLGAQSGWSQMQSPTLVFPGEGEDVCHFDRIRPARKKAVYRKGAAYVKDDNDKLVSISTHSRLRRIYGIGSKHHQFYKPYLPAKDQRKAPEIDFVNDFHQMSDYPAAKRLHHKIAVIYLDGNGFGSIFRGLKTDQEYANFSKQLKEHGGGFLKEALKRIDAAAPDQSSKTAWHWKGEVLTNRGKPKMKNYAIRLETLLWGGDEIIWVVPAWQGWWMLENYFWNWGKAQWDEQPPDPVREGANDKLRWGGAMIFCHHDAPIHDITSLAHDLADQAKEKKDENRFVYQVLESFDSLGKQAAALRTGKLPKALRPKAAEFLVLPGNSMAKIREGIQQLRPKLPRGRVHEIVAELCRSEKEKIDLTLAEKVLEKAEAKTIFAELRQQIYGATPANVQAAEAGTWIHLNELWDYIPQEAKA